MPDLLFEEFLFSEFLEVCVPFRHALLELLIKIFTHLVEFVPFPHHLLPLVVAPLVLPTILDHFITQIPLQELQVTLVCLLLFSLKTKDFFQSISRQHLIALL